MNAYETLPREEQSKVDRLLSDTAANGGLAPVDLDAFWRDPPRPDMALREGFLRGIAHCLHIRGVYYAKEGLDVAVRQATHCPCRQSPTQLAEETAPVFQWKLIAASNSCWAAPGMALRTDGS